jgi:SnoaL-like protein
MNGLQRLEAIEEIKQLKARYFRSMDTKDWDGFGSVFAPDAVMDMRAEAGEAGLVRGAAAIVEFVRSAVDPVVTVHHGHCPEIEITSETTASGIWAMEDRLRWPAGGSLATMHGWGHYHETYVLFEGRWLIETLTLTRLRVDFDG